MEDRLLLSGGAGQGRCDLSVPFSDLAEIRIGRGRADRLNGYATLVLERGRTPAVQVAPLGAGLLHEIADLLLALAAEQRAGGDVLAVVVPLKPNCLSRATKLLKAGPPLDPAALGLTGHQVYLRAGEVVFVFRGPNVSVRVGKSDAHPGFVAGGACLAGLHRWPADDPPIDRNTLKRGNAGLQLGRTGQHGVGLSEPEPPSSVQLSPAETGRASFVLGGLVRFEELLYAAVGVLLAAAAVLVLVGTVHELAHGISSEAGAITTAVTVLDRILLTLIIAELVYTLRFVLRTHEIVVEPFLVIGLIAVVRRILIVTAQFERPPAAGRALTNLLLELGLLGFLALALAVALALVRRYRASLP